MISNLLRGRLFSIENIWEEEQDSSTRDSDDDTSNDKEGREADLLKLSLQAFNGEVTPETMKLQGVLKEQLIKILVDSSSTDNYLYQTLASKLAITPDNQRCMDVVVANGERLSSAGSCTAISWTVQGHLVSADFHLLLLREFDMVLGIQWLRMFGPIMWDCSQLRMTFTFDGKEITLHGVLKPSLKVIDSNRMVKAVHKRQQGIHFCTCLQLFLIVQNCKPMGNYFQGIRGHFQQTNILTSYAEARSQNSFDS